MASPARTVARHKASEAEGVGVRAAGKPRKDTPLDFEPGALGSSGEAAIVAADALADVCRLVARGGKLAISHGEPLAFVLD
jgi:hypothetical protein